MPLEQVSALLEKHEQRGWCFGSWEYVVFKDVIIAKFHSDRDADAKKVCFSK